MTKRAYPFEIGVLRQFKMHVNTFQCDKAALKDIERKTVDKLFMAQKRDVATCQSSSAEVNSSKDKSLKQMQLSSYFAGGNGIPLHKEIHGSMNSGDAMSICSYCEKPSDNISKCRICLQQNCHSCSFPDYNSGSDEGRICITCS